MYSNTSLKQQIKSIYTHKQIILCLPRDVFTQNLILAGIIFRIIIMKNGWKKYLKKEKKAVEKAFVCVLCL